MNPSLDHIAPLATLEEREADAREAIRVGERKLATARAQVAERAAEVAGIDEELAALRARERALQDEVRKAESQQASARRALDQGLGDSAAAERQLARCAETIDAGETGILEIMERRDALTSARDDAGRRHTEAVEGLAALVGDLEPTLAALRSELAELAEERARLVATLPRDASVFG